MIPTLKFLITKAAIFEGKASFLHSKVFYYTSSNDFDVSPIQAYPIFFRNIPISVNEMSRGSTPVPDNISSDFMIYLYLLLFITQDFLISISTIINLFTTDLLCLS